MRDSWQQTQNVVTGWFAVAEVAILLYSDWLLPQFSYQRSYQWFVKLYLTLDMAATVESYKKCMQIISIM